MKCYQRWWCTESGASRKEQIFTAKSILTTAGWIQIFIVTTGWILISFIIKHCHVIGISFASLLVKVSHQPYLFFFPLVLWAMMATTPNIIYCANVGTQALALSSKHCWCQSAASQKHFSSHRSHSTTAGHHGCIAAISFFPPINCQKAQWSGLMGN